jgi:hypothetical protein
MLQPPHRGLIVVRLAANVADGVRESGFGRGTGGETGICGIG